MPAPANLVHQTSTTTGTGNLTVVAVNGKQSFSDAFGTGGSNVFDYFISNQNAAEWERGTGSMSDATTLVRDTVLESTNSDAAVDFSAGTKDVANDVPAGSQYIGAIFGIVEDQKTAGTNGQSMTSGGDRTRELTTIVYNRDSLISLSSDQITIPAGTWLIKWSAQVNTTAEGSASHKTHLYNVTGTAVVAYGRSGNLDLGTGGADTQGTAVSEGSTVVTIASSTAFEIRHRVSINLGGGLATGAGTEVYTRVEIYAA